MSQILSHFVPYRWITVHLNSICIEILCGWRRSLITWIIHHDYVHIINSYESSEMTIRIIMLVSRLDLSRSSFWYHLKKNRVRNWGRGFQWRCTGIFYLEPNCFWMFLSNSWWINAIFTINPLPNLSVSRGHQACHMLDTVVQDLFWERLCTELLCT